jgi:hypothetical protein
MATPTELLDLIIDRAPKLRAAGVLHVTIEGLGFSLDPGSNAASDDKEVALEDDDDLNPLDDPRTYGRGGKRKAPSFRGDL